MLHQSFQASRDMTCIRVEFIQMGLDQLLTIEDQVTWNCQDIFDKSRGVESGQWPIWEHPIRNPRERVVCHIGEEDERLLSGQAPLASLAELQSAFVCFDFGFARATIIVVFNDLGEGPVS